MTNGWRIVYTSVMIIVSAAFVFIKNDVDAAQWVLLLAILCQITPWSTT